MQEYAQCPSCNRDRPTLAIYPANVRCHACGYYSREHPQLGDTLTMSVKLPDITAFDWTSKKISSSVLDLYGVGMDSTGRVVSPHYSPDMELLVYHVRTPGQRDFRMHGSNVPLGLHTLGNNKELIICEGHTDTYSAKTMFPRCDVIGLPGSDTVKSLTPYLSKLRKYKRINIMCDGDSAGSKCADALTELLPANITYRVTLGSGRDVSDYLVEGDSEDLERAMSLATHNPSGKFTTTDDCEGMVNEAVYGRLSTGIDSLDDMLRGGFDTPSLYLVTGYTGIGKSAFVQQLTVNVAKSGTKVMYLAGEMTPQQTLDRLVHQWYGEDTDLITKEVKLARYKHVVEHILITKFSDITLRNVTETMEEAVIDYGCRLVVIDVLSDVEGFLSDYTSRLRSSRRYTQQLRVATMFLLVLY